jgi:hypothetical protein
MLHISGRRKMYTGFWLGNVKEEDHLEDLGVDNVKMCLKEIGWEGTGYVNLAEGRNKW